MSNVRRRALGGIGGNPRPGRRLWICRPAIRTVAEWPTISSSVTGRASRAADVRRLDARLVAAAGDVTYMGSVLIPDDEVALFGFRARNESDVRAAATAVGLRCDRIVAADFG